MFCKQHGFHNYIMTAEESKKRYKYIMVHTRKSKVFESVLVFVSTRGFEPPEKKARNLQRNGRIHLIWVGIFWHGDWFDVFCWGVEYELGTVGESQDWLRLKDPVGHLTTLRRLEHMWKMATDRKGGLKSWAHKSHNIYLWTMCNLGGMPRLSFWYWFLVMNQLRTGLPDNMC